MISAANVRFWHKADFSMRPAKPVLKGKADIP
jgi:hypothetical protein